MVPESVVGRWEIAYRRYREVSKAAAVAGDQAVAGEMAASSRDVAALWRELESTPDLPWWALAALAAAAQAFEFQARDWLAAPQYFPPEGTHPLRPQVRLTTRAQPTGVRRGVSRMDEHRVEHGHPANQLLDLQRRVPYKDQPVRVWAAWFERQAELWDAVALIDPWQTDTAAFVGKYLRRTAKEMLEQYRPHETWPGAASW